MKIIQIKNQVEGYAIINFGNINMMEIVKNGNVSILNGKSFTWDKSLNSAISDCPFYIGATPIFLTEKLGHVFDSSNVNMATFDVEGENYTIVLAPVLNENSINLTESKCRTFRSGKIMDVNEYVFTSGINYPEIFTPNEFRMFTFCNELIAKQLFSCHFNQLKFVECSIV